MDEAHLLKKQFLVACRRLLNEQNRDPHTPTHGCFDRRYWGWKLADYAEATLQRGVYPLAWLLRQADLESPIAPDVLAEAVCAGLQFACRIQHKDGSFDQAFPHEHSFGATAFLLHPLLFAYQAIEKTCLRLLPEGIKDCLHRAADFLCRHAETHGYIANHLAGAALSLLCAAEHFREARYEQRAVGLLEDVLAHQSPEGWFPEYEGADPGYQTLCLHYLAQVYRLRPEPRLREALERAVSFVAWFVHPDGTFGGEYGSRRTPLYYPGGLALLSQEFPLAWSMTRFMLQAISEQRTVTVQDVDVGNLVPLLCSYALALEVALPDAAESALLLPCECVGGVRQDFPQAGLYLRGTRCYYAILGTSNGGVLKVFDRERRALIWNDGGYVGCLQNGVYVTTQITHLERPCVVEPDEVQAEAPFFRMLRSVPTPFRFVILRLVNLTLRSVSLGNWIKWLLVRLLIRGKSRVPLHLSRRVCFEADRVVVRDTLRAEGRLRLRWLEFGRPFVGIHMASARYFEGGAFVPQPTRVDVARLLEQGVVEIETVI